MAEKAGPTVYSIAAHRGFADALVAGLLPRYSEPELGLARLTLLLPSARAIRTVSEAFVRLSGPSTGSGGLLMPRMAAVGDLDLDETLGPLLDPLGAADIPPAVDPTLRWLRLAEMLRDEYGEDAPHGGALLRLAKQVGRTMDRLLVEEIGPEELVQERVVDLVGDLAGHWQQSLRRFARVQARWLAELGERGALDTAARRNRLFDFAATRWKHRPPATSIVAAGVTSAAPALARLLRVVSDLPQGAVILPDLDLTMSDEVWSELGAAGASENPGDPPFGRDDAVTHPQYHLKLLLNRMGVASAEVQPWHRRGLGAAPPARSHAISSLFLPPQASKAWVDLPPEKRRLAGVRLFEAVTPEEEAQAISLLIRKTLEEPERRVALVTPDRNLARRVVHHLRRWNIEADDSAGRPLGQTPAGRLFLLLAEVAAERAAPVPLMALLQHPLVREGEGRRAWLAHARAFERKLRGPRTEPGLEPLRSTAREAGASGWWDAAERVLAPLLAAPDPTPLREWLDLILQAGEALAGEGLWAREDGRSLSTYVEDLRLHSGEAGTALAPADAFTVLREELAEVSVRPPYGGHPRVGIYGLIESRMTRADLVICGGLNEGTWPAGAAPDSLLAPAVLRALGVPGADFRIGLAAHDLAAALGAAEVVLSRARRDESGPAIPSRFFLRVRALLGEDLADTHAEREALVLARALDEAVPASAYPRPVPMPSPDQRRVAVSVTGLDRLRADPYQFYASQILRLAELDPLDAEPSPAWQGELAHEILCKWHETGRPIETIADEQLAAMGAHPLTRALWRPRLLKALEWVIAQIANDPTRQPVAFEKKGEIDWGGVTIRGRLDRLDRLEDGTYAVVDYKTGRPPSGAQVEAGFALQLGTIGLMVERGGFEGIGGAATRFEYWSLGKSEKSETGFGYVTTPVREGTKRSGIPHEDFLPQAKHFLEDALAKWILGDEPFTARLNPNAATYATYDQLMRLDEWMGREA